MPEYRYHVIIDRNTGHENNSTDGSGASAARQLTAELSAGCGEAAISGEFRVVARELKTAEHRELAALPQLFQNTDGSGPALNHANSGAGHVIEAAPTAVCDLDSLRSAIKADCDGDFQLWGKLATAGETQWYLYCDVRSFEFYVYKTVDCMGAETGYDESFQVLQTHDLQQAIAEFIAIYSQDAAATTMALV